MDKAGPRLLGMIVLALTVMVNGAGGAAAANKYWVGDGGNTNWSTAANWSAVSGGADGAAPVAGDVVIFDGSSTNTDTICDMAIPAPGVSIQAGGAGSSVTVNNTLTLAAGASLSISSSFLFLGGTGVVRLAGNATFSSGMFTSTATIENAGFTLTFDSNGIFANITGNITGTGGIIKAGTGDLTLGGANTYTGSTTISTGRLFAGGGNGLSDTGALILANVASARLSLNNSETVGPLSGGGAAGGNINTNGNMLTVNQTADGAYNGVISGAGGLTKSGAAKLTLTNTNTYTGATNINGGTLETTGSNLIDGVSPFGMSATGILILGGNQTARGLNSPAGASVVTSTGTTLTIVVQEANATFGGIISGGGNLTKSGTAHLWLTGANTYTGTTTINEANFLHSQNDAIPSTSDVIINPAAGGFSGGLMLENDDTVKSVSGSGELRVDNASILTINPGADTVFSGNIHGTGGIVKNGAFKFTLGGGNTYSGATIINAGILATNGSNRLPDASDITLGAGVALELGGSDTINTLTAGAGSSITIGAGSTLTVDQDAVTSMLAAISGAGGLTVAAGSGSPLTLGVAATHTGTTTIDAGLILGGPDFLHDTSDVTLGAAGILTLGGAETINTLTGAAGSSIALGANTLTVAQDADAVFAGTINGAGGALVKNGAGKLTLSGAGGYTGATTINAGTLNIQNATATGTPAGGVTVAAGASLELQGGIAVGAEALTLNAGAANELVSVGGSNSWAGTVDMTGGVVDIVVTANNLTIGGIIGDAGGGFAKSGAGALVLSGANTFTGATTINAGTLNIQNATAAGTAAGGVNVAAGASLELQGGIAVGAEALTLNAGAANELVNVSGSNSWAGTVAMAGGAVDIVTTADGLVIGGVMSDAGGGFAKSGAGTLVLAGVNTYTGATSINAGNLQTGGAETIPNASDVTIGAAGSLTLGGAETVNTLTGAAGSSIALGANTLTVVQDADAAYAGAINGVNGALVKNGAGKLTLSGAGGYTGATTVNAGTLNLQNAAATGTTAGGVTVAAGASLELQGGIAVGAEALTLNAGAANELVSVSGSNSWGGTIAMTGGAVDIVVTANDLTIGGVIGDAGGGFAKAGAGTLVLSGVNTYTGATAVTAGTLNLRNATAVGTPAGGVTVAAGASLELQGGVAMGAEALTLNAGAANELVSVSGSNSWAGTVAMTGGAVDIVTTADDLTIGGIIGDAGGGFAKSGAGTLVLSGENTYTGATAVNAGILNLRHNTAVGSVAGGVTTATGASLELQGGITVGAEALTLNGDGGAALELTSISGNNTWAGPITLASGAVDITSAAGLLTLGSTIGGNQNLTFDATGDIAAAGIGTAANSITKNGAGALTLTGAISNTGAVTLNAGTISVGSVAGPVTVNNAAILAGTGPITGPVVMNDTSIIAPGGSGGDLVGILAITGNLTFNNTAKYVVTMTGGAIDKLVVNGDLAAGPGRNVEFQSGYSLGALALSIPVAIMDVTGAYTALDNNLPAGYIIDAAKVGTLIRLTAYPAGAIPTLNEWGVMIMMLLLAGAGVRLLRKHPAGIAA